MEIDPRALGRAERLRPSGQTSGPAPAWIPRSRSRLVRDERHEAHRDDRLLLAVAKAHEQLSPATVDRAHERGAGSELIEERLGWIVEGGGGDRNAAEWRSVGRSL